MQHHSFFSNAQYYSQHSTVYFINGHQMTLAFMWVKNLFKLTLWLDGLAAGSTVSNWEGQIWICQSLNFFKFLSVISPIAIYLTVKIIIF